MPTVKEAQAAVNKALSDLGAAQKLYVDAVGDSQAFAAPQMVKIETELEDNLKPLFDAGFREVALAIQANRYLKRIAEGLSPAITAE